MVKMVVFKSIVNYFVYVLVILSYHILIFFLPYDGDNYIKEWFIKVYNNDKEEGYFVLFDVIFVISII